MTQLRVTHHSNASSFLDEAKDFLTRSEAENMLMLGIAGELAQSETPGAIGPSSSPPR